MIYNEYGDILNAEYILDNIINESMADIVNKVSRSAVQLIRRIADAVKNFGDILVSQRYRGTIHKLESTKIDYFKLINQSDKNVKIIIEAFSADGYGKWSSNFQLACSELKSNNGLSLEGLKNILYKKDGSILSKDEWFKSKKK